MNKEEWKKSLLELGVELNEKQYNQLDSFYEELIKWNEKINLTRITDYEEVLLKHYYDSLTITKVIDLNKVKTLCDVGTGAGFPGIVLKIAYPHLDIVLVDALQKRVTYLNSVIEKLGLTGIKAIHKRGEELEGKFDVVTSRAVANIEKLVNYTMHLVEKDGVFIAMKGNIEKELTKEVEKKLSQKYKIVKKEEFLLPKENASRSLIVMKNR